MSESSWWVSHVRKRPTHDTVEFALNHLRKSVAFWRVLAVTCTALAALVGVSAFQAWSLHVMAGAVFYVAVAALASYQSASARASKETIQREFGHLAREVDQ